MSLIRGLNRVRVVIAVICGIAAAISLSADDANNSGSGIESKVVEVLFRPKFVRCYLREIPHLSDSMNDYRLIDYSKFIQIAAKSKNVAGDSTGLTNTIICDSTSENYPIEGVTVVFWKYWVTISQIPYPQGKVTVDELRKVTVDELLNGMNIEFLLRRRPMTVDDFGLENWPEGTETERSVLTTSIIAKKWVVMCVTSALVSLLVYAVTWVVIWVIKGFADK